MIAASLVAAALFAATPRIAVLPLNEGDGVTAKTTESVGEALAGELRKLEKAELMTAHQLNAVVTLERQKELLGCADEGCLTEIAGALDVEQLVTGTLSRLGQSWLLQVQRVDARSAKVLAHASIRVQGDEDALLDTLPGVAAELLGGGTAEAKEATKPAPPPAAEAIAPPAPPALPAPYADVPYTEPVERTKLTLLTDGKGRYVAVTPRSVSGPHFAGDAGALYLQRIIGGGSDGSGGYSFTFWEPRGKQQGMGHFDARAGGYTLSCDRKKVPLTEVPAAKAKKLLAAAKLYDVRWQRQAHVLARDDDGNWFLADQARTPEGNEDFRVYLGEPGALKAYPARALARDRAGEIFRAANGRLKIDRQKNAAEWIEGDAKRPLTLLELHPHVSQIYGAKGPYQGMPLGTPCDGHLP